MGDWFKGIRVTPDASSSADDRIVVARVKAAWRMDGYLKLEVLSDFPDRFAPGSVLYLGPNRICIEHSRPIMGGLLVKLEGVDDRAAAESLRGMSLTVSRHSVEPLEDWTYYQFQIIDIEVWTVSGERLGKVHEVLVTGANDVYVVKAEGRRDVLVPAIKDVVVEINLPQNRMVVDLPEGLR